MNRTDPVPRQTNVIRVWFGGQGNPVIAKPATVGFQWAVVVVGANVVVNVMGSPILSGIRLDIGVH
jgi:hypothetical protein